MDVVPCKLLSDASTQISHHSSLLLISTHQGEGVGTEPSDLTNTLRGLQNHMQVFSLNLGTVYVNTLKREFACQP